MSDSRDPQAWVSKAEQDLLAIENNVNAARVPWSIVCYHAQQTAEKMLKAYIVSHRGIADRTHDLLALLDECEALGAAVTDLREDCKYVLRYGAITRYPGSGFEPTEQQARKSVEAARRVYSRLLSLVRPGGAR
jgi:HEPN domain-containing protein